MRESQLPAPLSGLRRVRFVIYQESCRREAATTVRGCSVSGLATSKFITAVGVTASHMLQHRRESGSQGVLHAGTRLSAALWPPTPFPSAIPPTIAAANTFPGTRVMILLYYANYAVAAHGQWCILMAIVAQRGAIAIDQSCSGYANSSSTWRVRSAEGGWRVDDGRWWKRGNGWWRGQNDSAISTKSLYCHFVTATC